MTHALCEHCSPASVMLLNWSPRPHNYPAAPPRCVIHFEVLPQQTTSVGPQGLDQWRTFRDYVHIFENRSELVHVCVVFQSTTWAGTYCLTDFWLPKLPKIWFWPFLKCWYFHFSGTKSSTGGSSNKDIYLSDRPNKALANLSKMKSIMLNGEPLVNCTSHDQIRYGLAF